MNKYNIQAIRKELEDYIRNSRWKPFRTRFQSLNDDLAEAVVMNHISKNKHNKRSQKPRPLLCHMLCYSRQHPNSVPLPVDVLEQVIQASPERLLHITTSQTPLAIALEHSAPYPIIETLILNDKTKKCLYVVDRKSGDTPILHAIKQELDDGIIRLLIQSDHSTRQSLLLGSKKRDRVPLFYAANQSLSYLRQDDMDVPDELQYILLQTYIAVQNTTALDGGATSTNRNEDDGDDDIPSLKSNTKRLGVKDKDSNKLNSDHAFDEDDVDSYDDYGYYDDDDDDWIDFNVNQEEHWTTLLEATIATAHLLGTKNIGKLLAFLVPKVIVVRRPCSHPIIQSSQDQDSSPLNKCDATATTAGVDTLLHHVCSAAEEQSFLEPNIYIPSLSSPTVDNNTAEPKSLLHVLVCVYPETLFIPNSEGQYPIHIAIQRHKSWEFIKYISTSKTARLLASSSSSSAVINNQRREHGSLPLHLALLRSNKDNKGSPASSSSTTTDTIITELWKLYPEASAVVDGTTQLFPFQLAAAASSSSSASPSALADKQTISHTYFFLRSSPEVLNQYTSNDEK